MLRPLAYWIKTAPAPPASSTTATAQTYALRVFLTAARLAETGIAAIFASPRGRRAQALCAPVRRAFSMMV